MRILISILLISLLLAGTYFGSIGKNTTGTAFFLVIVVIMYGITMRG